MLYGLMNLKSGLYFCCGAFTSRHNSKIAERYHSTLSVLAYCVFETIKITFLKGKLTLHQKRKCYHPLSFHFHVVPNLYALLLLNTKNKIFFWRMLISKQQWRQTSTVFKKNVFCIAQGNKRYSKQWNNFHFEVEYPLKKVNIHLIHIEMHRIDRPVIGIGWFFTWPAQIGDRPVSLTSCRFRANPFIARFFLIVMAFSVKGDW